MGSPRGRRQREEEVEVSGDLDEHTVEAVRLEVGRLARRYGVIIKDFRVEGAEDRS